MAPKVCGNPLATLNAVVIYGWSLDVLLVLEDLRQFIAESCAVHPAAADEVVLQEAGKVLQQGCLGLSSQHLIVAKRKRTVSDMKMVQSKEKSKCHDCKSDAASLISWENETETTKKM